ncbi:MAG: hypothetical protein ACIAXF_14165 [Phycisphaerales bacterium JB063]
MTDINKQLAEAMGWKEIGEGFWRRPDGGLSHWTDPDLEFSTSDDAFRQHVLPELERRGLLDRWAAHLRHRLHVQHPNRSRTTMVATASPMVKCEAALAVMGGGAG